MSSGRCVNINPGEEWLPLPAALRGTFTCIVTLDRRCREQNPVTVNAEVNTLISEISDEADAQIYTDGSVVRYQKSARAFTARSAGRIVQEARGAFAMTTSCM